MAQRVQVDGRGVMEAEDPQGQSHRTDPEQESGREGEKESRETGEQEQCWALCPSVPRGCDSDMGERCNKDKEGDPEQPLSPRAHSSPHTADILGLSTQHPVKAPSSSSSQP